MDVTVSTRVIWLGGRGVLMLTWSVGHCGSSTLCFPRDLSQITKALRTPGGRTFSGPRRSSPLGSGTRPTQSDGGGRGGDRMVSDNLHSCQLSTWKGKPRIGRSGYDPHKSGGEGRSRSLLVTANSQVSHCALPQASSVTIISGNHFHEENCGNSGFSPQQ